MNKEIFKAYDVRGVYGEDFAAGDFYSIAQAYARVIQPRVVAVGYDVRTSSPELFQQVVEGLTDAGVDVVDIGGISTDMLYFAVANYGLDGGITVSASHNPPQYNGLKMVRERAIPISGDTELPMIREETFRLYGTGQRYLAARKGVVTRRSLLDDYLLHLCSFINLQALKPMKLVLNANCGYAGKVAERLLADMPVKFEYRPLHFNPDGTFKNLPTDSNGDHRPDPLIPENRRQTESAVREYGADFAVAWDADADRCFFFDETGKFIEGCYITGLLAEKFLEQAPKSKIICDPRLVWAIEDTVQRAGGFLVINKCGHSFIKARMREEDAIFGGEASAHYYFRQNFYTDNGMVPFLLMLELLSKANKSLSELVAPLRKGYPVSGEINFEFEGEGRNAKERVADALRRASFAIAKVNEKVQAGAFGENFNIEEPVDGLSVRYTTLAGERQWRFNLRGSNTEPKLRLNVEAFNQQGEDKRLLVEKTTALAQALVAEGAKQLTPFDFGF